MKLVSILSKLLGIPKVLKNQHILEMDFATDEDAFIIIKKSYNQNETVMFLKEIVFELRKLKKIKDLNLTEETKKEIPLLVRMMTNNDIFYLQSQTNKEKFVKEIHLINLRIISKKKTIKFENIEKNINQLGSIKIKNAVLRFMNKNKK